MRRSRQYHYPRVPSKSQRERRKLANLVANRQSFQRQVAHNRDKLFEKLFYA